MIYQNHPGMCKGHMSLSTMGDTREECEIVPFLFPFENLIFLNENNELSMIDP